MLLRAAQKAEIQTLKQNSLQIPHLLQRIHPPCQHVEVVEGGDGGGQVTLGMIQLFDIPGDFLHLGNEKGLWLNIKPQQCNFQEIRSHSLPFVTVSSV